MMTDNNFDEDTIKPETIICVRLMACGNISRQQKACKKDIHK